MIEKLEVSERRMCRALRFPRSSQRYEPAVRDDEPWLVADIVRLATQYGRYGYRRVTKVLGRRSTRTTCGATILSTRGRATDERCGS